MDAFGDCYLPIKLFGIDCYMLAVSYVIVIFYLCLLKAADGFLLCLEDYGRNGETQLLPPPIPLLILKVRFR